MIILLNRLITLVFIAQFLIHSQSVLIKTIEKRKNIEKLKNCLFHTHAHAHEKKK